MQKIDQTVRRETCYVALWVLILSAIVQAVFLIVGKWHYAVLIGNLISGGAGVLNFLFMGISLQKSLTKEPKDAALYMKGSSAGRFFILAAVTVLAVLLVRALCSDPFAILAVLIPLLFPRIAVAISPLRDKLKKKKEENDDAT